MCKDVFTNRYEWPNVVKNCNNFLKKIEELKPYIIEFEEDDGMKAKISLFDCAVEGLN